MTDAADGCQQKHTFINNNLNKTAEKMINNAAADDCRNGGKDHDTQFPADIHSLKFPLLFNPHPLSFRNIVFFIITKASSKVEISVR